MFSKISVIAILILVDSLLDNNLKGQKILLKDDQNKTFIFLTFYTVINS